jgi:hypothetical protein
MKIALDYDSTILQDHVLWETFVALAKLRKYEVVLVTNRSENESNDDLKSDGESLGVQVIYCAGTQKQDCFGADVWVDARPDRVVSTDGVAYLAGVLNCS